MISLFLIAGYGDVLIGERPGGYFSCVLLIQKKGWS